MAPIATPLNQQQNQRQSGRMLGSPGMITSATAEQMAMNGMVVEEFKPPQPEQNAIQLGALPPEVRQEFVRGLGLPPGARIMSAEIKGQTDGSSTKPESITAQPIAITPEIASSQLPKNVNLGGAGIVAPSEAIAAAESIADVVQKTDASTAETLVQPAPAIPAPPTKAVIDFSSERNELKLTIEKLQKQLEDQESAFAAKKTQIEAEFWLRNKRSGRCNNN